MAGVTTAEYEHIQTLMQELLHLAPVSSPRAARHYGSLAVACADILIAEDRARVLEARAKARALKRARLDARKIVTLAASEATSMGVPATSRGLDRRQRCSHNSSMEV